MEWPYLGNEWSSDFSLLGSGAWFHCYKVQSGPSLALMTLSLIVALTSFLQIRDPQIRFLGASLFWGKTFKWTSNPSNVSASNVQRPPEQVARILGPLLCFSQSSLFVFLFIIRIPCNNAFINATSLLKSFHPFCLCTICKTILKAEYMCTSLQRVQIRIW